VHRRAIDQVDNAVLGAVDRVIDLAPVERECDANNGFAGDAGVRFHMPCAALRALPNVLVDDFGVSALRGELVRHARPFDASSVESIGVSYIPWGAAREEWMRKRQANAPPKRGRPFDPGTQARREAWMRERQAEKLRLAAIKQDELERELPNPWVWRRAWTLHEREWIVMARTAELGGPGPVVSTLDPYRHFSEKAARKLNGRL